LTDAGAMATAKEAGELKQQGVIQAARDPESSVTAADVEKTILDESRKAGIPAFQFDPNASVEEKRAQARAVRYLPDHPRPLGEAVCPQS